MWLENLQDRPDLISPVTGKLRAMDRAEVFATRQNDSLWLLDKDILACGQISWIAGLERPIALFGCAPLWRGVWSMWLMATDEFPQIGFSVTKLVVKSIVPQMIASGAHRLEARSMEGHTDAHRWLEVIGAKREGTLSRYGRDRQDFHVYAWDCG